LRHHPLKAVQHATRSGRAKIVIDHFDLGPSQRGQTIEPGVLLRAVLAVVEKLVSRRLPYVDERLTPRRKMPLRPRLSSTRGAPSDLFGSNGWIANHSNFYTTFFVA
jgi:hypothetical protein